MTLPFVTRWRALASCLSMITIFAIAAVGCGQAESAAERRPYPIAAKGDVVDVYGTTKVADPYRWMEALDSKEVAEWVAGSNAVTDTYLARLPLRQHFNARLTELWNYQRVGVPAIDGVPIGSGPASEGGGSTPPHAAINTTKAQRTEPSYRKSPVGRT